MSSTAELHCLDLRALRRPQRHLLVFRTFEALDPGEAFEFVNDHEPFGLLYLMNDLRPGRFSWTYRMQGPDEWRVVLGRLDGDDVVWRDRALDT
jgi:uncharacterized protein (DUF2249 family)